MLKSPENDAKPYARESPDKEKTKYKDKQGRIKGGATGAIAPGPPL